MRREFERRRKRCTRPCKWRKMRMTIESTLRICFQSESKSRLKKSWNEDIKLQRSDSRRLSESKSESWWGRLRNIDLRNWNEFNSCKESNDKRNSWSNLTRRKLSLKRRNIKSSTPRNKNWRFSESKLYSMQNTKEQR